MHSFEYQHRTRLIFGEGSIDQLGSLAKQLGATRAMIVSDRGVVNAGHFARGQSSVSGSGLETAAFHDLHPNPTTSDVENALSVAREFKPDLLIGLGGGSSMDCAKGLNFLYSCGGELKDYWGVGKATADLLPMIAVPTTAGTGSEAQSFALISDTVTHVKMACGDRRALPAIAILDPGLTVTQPASVTALTGIDALTHALESYVTRTRHGISQGFARQAWQLMSAAFPAVINAPSDIRLRSDMQLGAYLSGMAIEASMLGAAHSLANPLTARFDIPHGQAVGLVMPHVIVANASHSADAAAMYRDLSHLLPTSDQASGADAISAWFTSMLQRAGLKTRLAELNVTASSIDELTSDALSQWTLQHNPVVFTAEQIAAIYQAAL